MIRIENSYIDYLIQKSGNSSNRTEKLLYNAAAEREKGSKSNALSMIAEAEKTAGDAIYLKNRCLNEKEITLGKTYLESKPSSLKLSITSRCNIRCIMCLVAPDSSFEMNESVSNEVIGLMPYLKEIDWLGGEVFLSDFFKDMFDEAIKYSRIRHKISTNALLMTNEWAEKIIRPGMTLTVSIDGINKNTYEHIRSGADFSRLLEKLELIRNIKESINSNSAEPGRHFRTMMNFVVMRSNYMEVEYAADFARKYGFDGLTLYPIEGIAGPENIFIDRPPEIISFLNTAVGRFLLQHDDFELQNLLPLENVAKQEISQKTSETQVGRTDGKNAHSPLICHMPWQNLYLDTSGLVAPQCYCPENIGSAERTSLMELWNSLEMQEYRNKILKKDLSWCDNKCRTGGFQGRDLKYDI